MSFAIKNVAVMKHVFIITYGRSGSTLLQNILNSCAGVCIRGENNNALVPLFRSYVLVKKVKAEHAADGRLKFQPWFGSSQLDDQDYARSLGEGFVKSILRPPPDTTTVGFKEIRYNALSDNEFSKYLDFILLAFKSTKLVFNTRNADDASRSSWWSNMDQSTVKEMIKKQDERFTNYSEANHGRCHTVCYDNYIHEPERLEPLFKFIEEPFDIKKVKRVLSHKLTH